MSTDSPGRGQHAEGTPPPDWTTLPDEELLKLRIRDLGLRIEGSEIEPRLQALRRELEQKGIRRFRPAAYLGDEWFTPEGVPAICVPFYLAHPRLKALEKKFMLEVEGGTEEWCMQLLRHETGHCLDHAYHLSRRKDWIEMFGSPAEDYEPEIYRPRPYSRSYVVHLENYYAQAHPHEDFAETFAVWLDPASDWEKRYARWPAALEKLRFVDARVRSIADAKPLVRGGRRTWAASRLTVTLERHYQRKMKAYREDHPDFFDSDLRAIFDGPPDLPRRDASAALFLRRNRNALVNTVSRWAGERKYVIDDLVRKLAARCQEIDLRLGKPEAQTNLEVAAYLASLVLRYQLTGRYKRTV
jgi:hypothetical protein